MDKETLSNYGWIVICVLVIAVMIALATPFGNFIAVAVKSTTAGLFTVSQNALGSIGLPGLNIPNQSFDGNTVPETPDDGEQETPTETPSEPQPEPEPVVEKAVRNERTLVEYDTVTDAANEAEVGDTIKMYKDTQEPKKCIVYDCALDLNGCTLNGKTVITDIVYDSKDGQGKIIATNFTVYGNQGDFPIHNSENGYYKFFKYELEVEDAVTRNGDVVFGFHLTFSNTEAYEMLKNDDTITINLNYTIANQDDLGYIAPPIDIDTFCDNNMNGNKQTLLEVKAIDLATIRENNIVDYYVKIIMHNEFCIETEHKQTEIHH